MDTYTWAVAAGAALAIILAVVIGVILGRNDELFGGFSEAAYDERQQKARVKAFKAGFFTLIIYNALYALSAGLLERPWCDLPTGCFIGICAGVTVFAVTCIMNDAYFILKNNPKKVIVLFSVIALFNALPALAFILDPDEGIITDGMLNFHSINLIIVAMFLIIFTAMLIKRGIDRRDEE